MSGKKDLFSLNNVMSKCRVGRGQRKTVTWQRVVSLRNGGKSHMQSHAERALISSVSISLCRIPATCKRGTCDCWCKLPSLALCHSDPSWCPQSDRSCCARSPNSISPSTSLSQLPHTTIPQPTGMLSSHVPIQLLQRRARPIFQTCQSGCGGGGEKQFCDVFRV